jgi:hypothetical protein
MCCHPASLALQLARRYVLHQKRPQTSPQVTTPPLLRMNPPPPLLELTLSQVRLPPVLCSLPPGSPPLPLPPCPPLNPSLLPHPRGPCPCTRHQARVLQSVRSGRGAARPAALLPRWNPQPAPHQVSRLLLTVGGKRFEGTSSSPPPSLASTNTVPLQTIATPSPPNRRAVTACRSLTLIGRRVFSQWAKCQCCRRTATALRRCLPLCPHGAAHEQVADCAHSPRPSSATSRASATCWATTMSRCRCRVTCACRCM